MPPSNPLEQALDLGGSRFIEASAGTGKTYALSKRYCRIIDYFAGQFLSGESRELWGPANILVITFTRKAAAEMSERIYRELSGLLDAVEEPVEIEGAALYANIRRLPEEKRNWLKSSFSGNNISTIDSFCARILRENYFKAGLEANFSLEEEAFDPGGAETILEQFLRRKSRELDVRLAALLDKASVRQVKEYFQYLYKQRQFLSGWLEYFTQSPSEDIWARWLSLYCPQYEVQAVKEKLCELSEFAGSDFKNEADGGRVFLMQLKTQLAAVSSEDAEKQGHAIIDKIIKPLFMTQKGEYRVKFEGNKSNWRNGGECEAYKQRAKSLTDYLNEQLPAAALKSMPDGNDARAISALKALASLYQEYESELSAHKRAQNYLSFNDVILMTHKLLSENEAVRLKYHNQFQQVMMDEFQDTNDLRWEIIQLICRDARGRLRPEGIFIVGDKKQSIYSFLQAEVEVMNNALKTLQATSKAPDEVMVRLTDNFRSSESFLHNAVNLIFSRIMPGSEKSGAISPFEVYFYPASYGAKQGSEEAERRRIEGCTPNVLLIQGAYASGEEAAPANEYLPALHTVSVVKQLLEWAEAAGIKEKPAVAVLFQRFTKIQHYINAFQKYQVPFEVAKGRGLFKQQEAADLFHIVSIILNPYDDFALMGLLRSPVFCISDSAIHRLICRREGQEPLYHYLQAEVEFRAVCEEIERWRARSAIQPLERLLQEILDRALCQMGYISETGGRQRLANLNLLIDLVHRLALSGMTLPEVHHYLRYSMGQEESAQAELSEAAQVHLMTIHQAKGLEFPAVVITEMNAVPHRETSPIGHGSIGGNEIEVGLALQDEEGEAQKTGLLRALLERTKAKREAEELRLFYVALTRAKYRAALLGEFKPNQRAENSRWKKYIRDAGLCPEGFEAGEWAGCSSDGGESSMMLAVESLHQNAAECGDSAASEPKVRVNLRRGEEIRSELEASLPQALEPVNWAPYLKKSTGGFYWETNPHQLMDLFFPEGGRYKDGGLPGSETAVSLAAGRLFHLGAEKGWFDLAQNRDKFRAILAAEYAQLPQKEVLEVLRDNLERFCGSALFSRLESVEVDFKAAERGITGWLASADGQIQVSGVMDLLFRRQGKYYCLDYKTDGDLRRLEAYRFQLQTYLWILRQIYRIEALGLLHFTALDKTIEVELRGDYFRHFRDYFNADFETKVPSSAVDTFIVENISEILAESGHPPGLIITRTKRESMDILKGLAGRGALPVEAEIRTLRELIMRHEISGRRLSPLLSRLTMEKVLSEIGHPNQSRSHAAKLAEGVLEAAEWGTGLLEEFAEAETSFHQFCKSRNWRTDVEIVADLIAKADFSGKTVILSGLCDVEPSILKLLRAVAAGAGRFYYVDDFSRQVRTDFEYDNRFYEDFVRRMPAGGQSCLICASAAEEVELTARRILAVPDWEKRAAQLKVAVSSMEMYVPLIKRIFAGCGIPVTIFKNEPISERPVTQMALGLLRIIAEGYKAEWRTIAGVVLNPMCAPGDDVFSLDKWAREHIISDYFQLEKLLGGGGGAKIAEQIRNAWEKVSVLISPLLGKTAPHPYRAAELVKEFMFKYGIEGKIAEDAVSSEALSKVYEIMDNVLHSYSMLEMKASLGEFIYDVRQEIFSGEARTGRQELGVEVLGFADAEHLSPEYLFVLGLYEGQFPAPPVSNPVARGAAFNYYYYYLSQLKRWMGLGGKVCYTAPRRSPSGQELEPSTFLQYLSMGEDRVPAAAKSSLPHHYFYERYYRKKILHPQGMPLLERHNQYQSSEPGGSFRGKVEISPAVELLISPSAMDDLLRCPMRYWFSQVAGLKVLDEESELEDRRQIGTVVHRALHKFGGEGGFQRLKMDISKAAALLSGALEQACAEQNIRLSDDLLQSNGLKYYSRGLSELSENNLLVKLLRWNAENLQDFTPVYFEKEFGDEKSEGLWQEVEMSGRGLKLRFQGRVDKIMISADEAAALASDYKTGEVEIKDIREYWSSQFPIYYLALKKAFPGKRIILVYEVLKSLQKSGIAALFGETQPGDEQMLSRSYKTKILTLDDTGENLSMREIEEAYISAAKSALEGDFHIAGRELYGKACEHCDYAALCRRDCVVTY